MIFLSFFQREITIVASCLPSWKCSPFKFESTFKGRNSPWGGGGEGEWSEGKLFSLRVKPNEMEGKNENESYFP